MDKGLTLSETCQFVKEARCYFVNGNEEIIVEFDANIFFSTKGLKTVEDLDAAYLLAISRPIAMSETAPARSKAKRWAKDTIAYNNKRWGVDFTTDDYRAIYKFLCYAGMIDKVVEFMRDGLAIENIGNYANDR